MSQYLLTDIGSTYTKVCHVDVASHTIIATASAPTTIATDVNVGLDAALEKLNMRPEDAHPMFVCSSAAGGLKIVAVGLVPDLTALAAKMAALGAGGKVLKTFAYRLNNDDIEKIRQLNPDILLLSGGTDGGDQQYLLHNGRKIHERLNTIPLIVAGNRDAYDELRPLFADRADVYFTSNVMPAFKQLDLAPTRELIREVFLQRIVIAKGLDRLQTRATVLMPTPVAVLKAVTLLAAGVEGEEGIGELLAIDIGGATTDVYSCAEGLPQKPQIILRGLQEPWEKRTVEADIGLRYTLRYLVEQCDLARLADGAGCSADELSRWVTTVTGDPGVLPSTPLELGCETALAQAACRIAVERHCGKIEQTWTPEGRLLIQEGKDCTSIRWTIGSGGPLAQSANGRAILEGALCGDDAASLKPKNPSFLLDRHYILWAMGLLAESEPRAALTIMKRYLEPI